MRGAAVASMMRRRMTPQTMFAGPTIAAASVAQGIGGVRNTVRTPGKAYGYHGRTAWAATVRGTAASLAYTVDNYPINSVELSVDGGAFVDASVVGGRLQLFSGLEDADHRVCVRAKMGYGDQMWQPTTGADGLQITGGAPSMTLPSTWLHIGDAGAGLSATLTYDQALVGFQPARAPRSYNGATHGSNTPAMRLRADCTWLVVVSTCRSIYVCTDGGAAVKHDRGAAIGDGQLGAHWIPCSAGDHTYNLAGSSSNVNNVVFSVGVVGACLALSTRKRLAQLGNSITEGNRYPYGSVETFAAAAAMGFVGVTFGVSGNSTEQLRDRMDSFISLGGWGLDDVAVIAIGVNDSSGWSATKTGYYTEIINKCLSAGFGRVLCRHMLPTAADYSAVNAGISAAAAACSDPSRVRVISTAGWPAFALIQVDLDEQGGVDGLHLSEPEYAAAAPYCASAYTAALAS
jgi:lysophospholipase L1-like esterase